MRKYAGQIICILIFLLICTGTSFFLGQFTDQADNLYTSVEWQSASLTRIDGTKTTLTKEEVYAIQNFTEGETYVFTAVLGKLNDAEYLRFDSSGAEICLSIDGVDIYHSNIMLADYAIGMSAADIPVDSTWEGAELTFSWIPKNSQNMIFPPLLRLTSDTITETSTMAYANLASIPTGVFTLAFLMICGCFLIGLLTGKPDPSLLALAIAACALTINGIVSSMGYFFLPEQVLQVLSWQGFQLLPLIGMVIYLLWNRKHPHWRYLGNAFLFTLIFLTVIYLVSLSTGSYPASLLHTIVTDLFVDKNYDLPLYWITAWFIIVCTGISAYSLFRTITDTELRARTMEIKNQLVMEDYRIIEEKQRQSAALRHEIKNHITALRLMHEKGNTEDVGHYLTFLAGQTENLVQTDFTRNITLNAILQNAASRAMTANIHFEAQVLVPEQTDIPETDLCGFLMNLLDNALESCNRMEENQERFIRFRAHIKQGFLAIRCENSYSGTIITTKSGLPKTVKPEPNLHGFGLRQMEKIAKKYGSILDISYTEDVFTVMTALKMK